MPFGAILVKAVGRRLVSDVADAHPLHSGHVRKEGDDVGRGQPGLHLVIGSGDAERPDRRGSMSRHAPQLSGQFHGRGLAVGPRHRDDRVWIGREKSGGEFREQLARLIGGKVRHAVDLGFRPRDHGRRAPLHRLRDEILAIEARAAESSENIARRDLAMVQCKARHFGIVRDTGEIAQEHVINAPLFRERRAAPRPCSARDSCRAGRRASARSG